MTFAHFSHRAPVAAVWAAACWLAMAATASMAQDQKPEPNQDQAQDRQVVVVTAQKRTELLKDVPAAISAYSGAQLQQLGLNNATEIRYLAPSVNFTPSANARGEGFSMRGVGTSVFSDSVEQSVGFVLDGVVVGRSGQASGDMLDVERIEVLRGPQGMLFGKNASAGLISVVTKRPRLDATTAEGNVSAAQYNEYKLQAVGNLPMTDTLALRLAYGATKADGNVRNIANGERLNNRDEQLLRAKVLITPTPLLEIYAIADASERRTRCCAWTARSAPPNTPFGQLNAAAGIVPSPDNLNIAAGAPFFQNANNRGVSVEANYDLGWATVTSLTAYRTWFSDDNNDPDLLPVNILDLNDGTSRLRQKTQELRLTSPDGGAVEWVGGLYWYQQRNRSVTEQAGTLGAGANILGTVLDTTAINKSRAAFGQAGWRVTPMFKLVGGARYTRDTVALDFLQFRSPSAVASIPGRYLGPIAGELNKSNLSWRATAQLDFAKDHMAYLTTARGFKGPGVNTLGVATNTLEVIQPEVPTTIEAGARAVMLGGALQINAAVFKTRFDDFQAQVFDQTVTPGRFRIANAGRLNTEGLELEANARPLPGLTLSGSMALVRAKYGDFKNIACYTGQPILPFGTVRTSPRDCIRTGPAATAPAVTEGTGNTLANAPRTTLNVAARYETALSGFKLNGQINYAWRDKVSFSAAGDPNLVQAAYGLLGASVGFGPADGSWAITLFGKNLTDERYAANVISQPVLNAPGVYSQFVGLDARRSVGAALNVRFGQ